MLDRWCASVGPPAILAPASSSRIVRRLLVSSWNVHVGGGRIEQLIADVRGRSANPAGGDTGIVLLLQEAFRGGDAVPETAPAGVAVPANIHPPSRFGDIADVARRNGLALAYVPSMRNGEGNSVEREDRGSAILSTEPLSEVTAIELPFGRERRVAVLATVTPRGSASPLRVLSGHLDVLSGAQRQAQRLADYLRAHRSGPPLVVGLDTNALFGARSGAVHAIEAVVPRLTQCGTGRTNMWLARIDFLFSDLPASTIAGCDTLHDRYGSDHVPQVLTLDY
jgi:endonuclease/exonuclease/phosphatase family metal-dependent hydrolase